MGFLFQLHLIFNQDMGEEKNLCTTRKSCNELTASQEPERQTDMLGSRMRGYMEDAFLARGVTKGSLESLASLCIIFSLVMFQQWSIFVWKPFSNLSQLTHTSASALGHIISRDSHHTGAVIYLSDARHVHCPQRTPSNYLSLQANRALRQVSPAPKHPLHQGPPALL